MHVPYTQYATQEEHKSNKNQFPSLNEHKNLISIYSSVLPTN